MCAVQLSTLMKGGPGQVKANAQGMMMQKMMEQMMKQGGAPGGGAGANPFGNFPGSGPGAGAPHYALLGSRAQLTLIQLDRASACSTVCTGCTEYTRKYLGYA